MKKRWLVPLVFVISWFFISLFFYYHHQVIVKTMAVPGWDLQTQTPSVQIKEIRLFNKTTKPIDFDQYSTGISNWVISSNFIPNEMKRYFMNLVFFYHAQYQANDAWYIVVSGVYSSLNSKDIAEMPDITIQADGEYISSYGGRSSRSSEGSNIRFFTVGGKGVKPDVKNIEVTWKWRGKTEVKRFNSNFRTNKYGFFSKKPREYESFDPEPVASKLFWDFKQGKKANASPELVQKIEWARAYKHITVDPSVIYIGTYKGYDDVLLVRMNYSFDTYTNPDARKIDKIQDFFVAEVNGILKVIDIGPVKS